MRSASGAPDEAGFTLIEIGIILLVMVLLMAVAVPTLESVMGAKARAEVSKLAANIRATRGHAAVSGETCRMVFCIDTCGTPDKKEAQPDDSYYIECTKGDVPIAHEEVRNGQLDEKQDLRDFGLTDEAEKEKLALEAQNAFTPAAALPLQEMKGAQIRSVWTAHQTDKYEKGRAFLYFFPSGLTELGDIQLQDGDDWYTVEVSPLSGKVKVLAGKQDIKQQYEEDDF